MWSYDTYSPTKFAKRPIEGSIDPSKFLLTKFAKRPIEGSIDPSKFLLGKFLSKKLKWFTYIERIFFK
jgi:hypothetical protein